MIQFKINRYAAELSIVLGIFCTNILIKLGGESYAILSMPELKSYFYLLRTIQFLPFALFILFWFVEIKIRFKSEEYILIKELTNYIIKPSIIVVTFVLSCFFITKTDYTLLASVDYFEVTSIQSDKIIDTPELVQKPYLSVLLSDRLYYYTGNKHEVEQVLVKAGIDLDGKEGP